MHYFVILQALAGIIVTGATLRFVVKHSRDDATTWERSIRRFERADRLQFPPRGVTVFAGSSSIRTWKSLQADMAPLKVLNRGFGGAQIHDVTHYVPRIVTPYAPSAVVFYAGENDMVGVMFSKRKNAVDVREAFRKFCQAVHADLPDVPIYFIAIKPPKRRLKFWPEMQTANQLVEQFCSTDAQLHFIDIVPSMLDENSMPLNDVFRWDGIHLNEKGYAIWTSVIKPILTEAFIWTVRRE